MTSSRIAIVAFAAALGASVLIGTPASAGQWSWLGNKDYVNCLKLFHYGNFMMPRNLSPAQQAAHKEKGRRYCNRQYYGHD